MNLKNPSNLEKGDFVHLISRNRRINSGAIDNIDGCKIKINSAVDRENTIYLIYSHRMCAYFFESEDEDVDYFENGIRLNPHHPFYLEQDDSRLPIAKTGQS
jgi:hypothetical protein